MALPTVISFAFAAALIIFLLSRFDIDLSEMWRSVRGGNVGLLFLALFLYYMTFPLRGLRWRMLLQSSGAFDDLGGRRPSVAEHSLLILISWFANSISWFRMGDALRAFLLSDRWKLSFPRNIGTVLAERFVDIGVVVALLLLAGVGLLKGDTSKTAGVVVVAASSLAGGVGVGLLALRLFGLQLTRLLPGRLRGPFERFQEGTLGGFRRLPLLVVITVAIWMLEAGRLFFVIEALDFDVALSLILFSALAHSLLTTIPITPGGLGFVELGLTGLLVLALPRVDAATVTLLDRSITYFSILVIGGAAFAIRQAIEMRRAAAPGPEKTE